jgi:ATP-dependent Clp endopeptidase proteolytic subunit ClpP
MDFLTIENRRGKLRLNEPVHKESADKLIEELGELYGQAAVASNMRIGEIVCSADDALEEVEVEINSPGGSVLEGQRIYNALREMASRGVAVETTVNGLAASMGSVILMAGDKRKMTKGSRIMIHEASSMAYGDARTMKKTADLLDSISAEIAGIYAERTGKDASELRGLMMEETWMDAEKAMEFGFVGEILDFKKKATTATGFDTKAKAMSILAKLFPGNDQIQELEAQVAENETLRLELIDAQARISELSGLSEIIAQKDAEIAEITGKLSEAQTKATENAATIAELSSKAEVTPEIVSLQAAELLAATGHSAPVDLSGDTGDSGKSLYDKYRDLKSSDPRAAAKFWEDNKEAMIADR